MWELIHLLPNINISIPLENKHIAIVNHNDGRIKEITNNHPHLKVLINNFTDQFSNKILPSILLVSQEFKNPSEEAIVAFRNILAISTISKGFEHRFLNTFVAFPLYSEYFDFYPLTTLKDSTEICYDTPSVRGIININDFNGQSYPFLFGIRSVNNGYCSLLILLKKIWMKCFISNPGRNWSTTKLFRSLEMAYQACSIPNKNNHSMYDHGVSASLWVSAFEILSHPGNGRQTDKWKVSDLLGEYNWHVKSSVTKNSFHQYKRKNILVKINLVQKLYFELNNLRNNFLHGNKVTANNIRPFKKFKNKSFIYYAPLIYKIALISFLESLNSLQVDTKLSFDDELLQGVYRSDYEDPIRKIFLSIYR